MCSSFSRLLSAKWQAIDRNQICLRASRGCMFLARVASDFRYVFRLISYGLRSSLPIGTPLSMFLGISHLLRKFSLYDPFLWLLVMLVTQIGILPRYSVVIVGLTITFTAHGWTPSGEYRRKDQYFSSFSQAIRFVLHQILRRQPK